MVKFVSKTKCSGKLKPKIGFIGHAPHLLFSDRPSSPLQKKKQRWRSDLVMTDKGAVASSSPSPLGSDRLSLYRNYQSPEKIHKREKSREEYECGRTIDFIHGENEIVYRKRKRMDELQILNLPPSSLI